jgi:RNA polymerase sigma-70 factor, ECF subfamily
MTREQQCVQRFCASGDEDAFRELYRLHAAALYRMSCRMLGSSGEPAEDAVQETWLRAARSLPAFRWESSLATWLMGIAINCCREARRRRLSRSRDAALDDERNWLSRTAPQDARQLDLEQAIARLGEEDREVLLLHDVEGYTHAEIGAALGIPEGTSKSHLSRARRRLRKMLSEVPAAASANASEGERHAR